MDELYEYMKEKHEEACARPDRSATIEMEMFLKLFNMVCYMRQVKHIVESI